MKEIIRLLFFISPLYLNAQLFTAASQNLPLNGSQGQSMDVRAADIDGDGDLDIVLANEFQANTILLNDGNGIFTNGTVGNLPQVGHDSEDVVIADFNNDKNLDLVFCSEDDVKLGRSQVHEYYLGDGKGKFSAAPFSLPDSESNAVICADLNGDQLPDLLFGNEGGTTILINKGDGTFSTENNRITQLSRTTQDLALADVDGDGDLDLFEGNENGNALHINNGQGVFSDKTSTLLPRGLNIETRKVTFGDVDADNDLDIFLSNVAFIQGKNAQNRLLLNDGKGNFSDATNSQLPKDSDHTIDAIFEDVDLDMDLDLIVCNVFGGPIKIYENDGKGNFTNSTQSILGKNYFLDALGVIAADLNGDGLRDIYICDRKLPQSNNQDLLLLRNLSTNSEEVDLSNSSKVLIYPNPVSDYFYIQSREKQLKRVKIFDTQGKEVAVLNPEKKGDGLFMCELEPLAAGIYFIKVGKQQYKIISAP